MSDYTKHGEFKPDQVVTRPEPPILAEMEAKGMGGGDSPTSPPADHQGQDGRETGDNSAPRMDVAGEIVLIDLSLIRRNPANPNYHTIDQVGLLARNIKRYGLNNAVELKRAAEDDDYQFEILAGEGRYLAYCWLRDTEGSGKWRHIPAIVRDDDADVGTSCGKRLSENRLRWFNWAAECSEISTLKANGETMKKLMETFGYKKSTVANMVATGECLKRVNLTKEQMLQLTGTLTRQAFIDHVVPLRVLCDSSQTKTGQKGFSMVDPDAYDYTRVKACVDALLSDELKKDDLPQYSQEHRPSGKKSRTVKAKTERESSQKRTEEKTVLPGTSPGDQQRSGDESPTGTPDAPMSSPESTGFEGGDSAAHSETTSEIASGSSDKGEIAPKPESVAERSSEVQPSTEKQDESPEPAKWANHVINSVDLADVTWILLGGGIPPTAEWAKESGASYFFVRPDGPEKQLKRGEVPENTPASAEVAPRSDENSDPEVCTACVHGKACANETCGQKECFGDHPGGIQPDCLMCHDEGACEKVSKFPIPCFGSNPEYSDRGIPTVYDCGDCQLLTDCRMESIAVVDNGKINFSDAYGELKGSGCFSELYFVPSNSDSPVQADAKFLGKKMILTSRRWANAIKPFLKEPNVREIFQKDHLGNVITRTTKDPEKTVWYVVNKRPGATA